LTIDRSLWPAGPLLGSNSSNHRRILLTIFLFLQSAYCTLFFIGCFSLSLLTCFFPKKRCQHMPPSFRVNIFSSKIRLKLIYFS
jgi:hypothetical protein